MIGPKFKPAYAFNHELCSGPPNRRPCVTEAEYATYAVAKRKDEEKSSGKISPTQFVYNTAIMIISVMLVNLGLLFAIKYLAKRSW